MAETTPIGAPFIAPSKPFLGDQLACITVFYLAQRDAPQRDRERLAAGVSRLAGQHGKEHREDDKLVYRSLEYRHHAARQKRGQQVQLQPGMAKYEAAQHRRRDALLLVDADHAAGLRGDFESFRFEDRLAAYQTQQLVPGRRTPDRPDNGG